MKCARLHLQERSKTKPRATNPAVETCERARRYCQRRMVDPGHEEDPRWREGIMERFHCNLYDEDHIPYETCEETNYNHNPPGDMFLSVQTLKFQGDTQERKPSRTCFKYKALAHDNRHRMFVKEIIEDQDNPDEDCSSQQNSYYLEDYVKYIMSTDRSRPSTGKSSLCMREERRDSKDKAVQVEMKRSNLKSKQLKPKTLVKKSVKLEEKAQPRVFDKEGIGSAIDKAKISYHKSGKRKSITISRAQSPETVQVIRVDVVCNYSSTGSTISDFDETKKQNQAEGTATDDVKVGIKNSNFASKYLLTKTIKSLDENVAGGAKVTLLCKTYRLAERVRSLNEARKQINPVKNKTFGFRSKANVLK